MPAHRTVFETRQDLLCEITQRVEVGENGCWHWLKRNGEQTSNGVYGRLYLGNRQQFGAHVIMYEVFRGPIPDGLYLDHLCRNPPCVNPDHLEPVTVRENTLRGIGPSAMAARKTHCPQGHPYSHDNTRINGNKRYCRICVRLKSHRKYYRDRGLGIPERQPGPLHRFPCHAEQS